MANSFVMSRGIKPIKSCRVTDYCPKCLEWGQKQIALCKLGNLQIITFLHQETISGYQFTYRRCYIG